jgi:hypothetical protein
VATNDLRPYLLCDEPTRMDDGLCDRCAAEGEAENREPETCPGCTADLGDPDARHDADCSEMARGDQRPRALRELRRGVRRRDVQAVQRRAGPGRDEVEQGTRGRERQVARGRLTTGT